MAYFEDLLFDFEFHWLESFASGQLLYNQNDILRGFLDNFMRIWFKDFWQIEEGRRDLFIVVYVWSDVFSGLQKGMSCQEILRNPNWIGRFWLFLVIFALREK